VVSEGKDLLLLLLGSEHRSLLVNTQSRKALMPWHLGVGGENYAPDFRLDFSVLVKKKNS
jgi:hypothetical protein